MSVTNPFDPEDPKIKREILTMIVQYLEENGLRSSAVILRNEARFQVLAPALLCVVLLVLLGRLAFELLDDWLKLPVVLLDEARPDLAEQVLELLFERLVVVVHEPVHRLDVFSSHIIYKRTLW